jgi:hypothetical protein
MSEQERMDLEAKHSSFIEDLTKDIERLRRHAQSWARGAYLCYGVAVAASAATTLLAATNLGPQPLLAVLTSIPAIALLVNSVFSFEAKTRWCWGKVAHYGALLNQLKFEGCPVDEASKDRRIFDKEMQEQFPRFGVLPSQLARSSGALERRDGGN